MRITTNLQIRISPQGGVLMHYTCAVRDSSEAEVPSS